MKGAWSLAFFILRLCTAILFISAGFSKLFDPGHFLAEIQAFHLLPYWIAYSTAHILPWLEVISGFALLTFGYSSAAAAILMVMTISFMAFLGLAHLTGNNFDCGCFGKWSFIGDYGQHMRFNAMLFAALCLIFLRCAKLQRVIEKNSK